MGTGWGSFHCKLVREASPSAKLFVCGRNPEKAARLSKAVGADDFFVDLEQAIEDARVQAFTLALPHDLHRQAVEAVAAAGKHALVEKPIATTLQDADAMITAARKADTILMVARYALSARCSRSGSAYRTGRLGRATLLLAHAGGIRRPRGWAAEKVRMGVVC